MATYRDAVLCKNGQRLLALAVAGEANINFTHVKTSSTKYEATQLEALTDIGEIVQSNRISASTKDSLNTISLYAAFSNAKLIEGYFVRNFGIYATDPDDEESEILYAIVSADESEYPATFIPAYSNKGTSGVDFACEIVVANSKEVTVVLDENAGVPLSVFNDFAERFNQGMQEADEKLSDMSAQLDNMSALVSNIAVRREITIPKEGWATGADEVKEGALYIDIPQEDVTEEMIPYISLYPLDADTAKACGMSTSARTLEGVVRLYAKQAPENEIRATLLLFFANSETGGSSSGGGTYVLPVATANRLGGVKIGAHVNVTKDGTISVDDEKLLTEVTVSENETNEVLDEIFGTPKQ